MALTVRIAFIAFVAGVACVACIATRSGIGIVAFTRNIVIIQIVMIITIAITVTTIIAIIAVIAVIDHRRYWRYWCRSFPSCVVSFRFLLTVLHQSTFLLIESVEISVDSFYCFVLEIVVDWFIAASLNPSQASPCRMHG